MIRLLSIRHLAVVEQIEIEFAPGLNVLTGETGTGKSILIDALALLLGERASTDLIRQGAPVATVQAELEVQGRTILVRREIAAQGRNRAFLDDNLITTNGLRSELAAAIELHGQHEHQRLLSPAAQLELLDGFAELGAERATVATSWDAWKLAEQRLGELEGAVADRAARLEHARFALAELDRVDARLGEDEELERERTVLANTDRLFRLSREAYGVLYEDDDAVLPRLRGVFRKLQELAAIDPRFSDMAGQQGDVEVRLDELARSLRTYVAGLDHGADRLQVVEDRLAALGTVKRRFGPSLGDACRRREELRQLVRQLEGSAEAVDSARAANVRAREVYLAAASQLSNARRLAAPRMCAAIEGELDHLALAGATCAFQLERADEGAWSGRGVDAGQLLLSANLGEAPRALARVASGGELSRIMLACHMVRRGSPTAETLIFDEVDAGIGGQAADAVGARLRRLAEHHQVLCVTHLPQVAAYGTTHFRVEKLQGGGRTTSTVYRLTDADRVAELARMMVGSSPDASARAAAQSLLEARRSPRAKAKVKK